jgi:hypothetical protein
LSLSFTFVLIALWAASCAFFCFASFEAVQHPADGGPLPFNNWTFVSGFATLVVVPTPIWAILVAGFGWWFVWSRTLGHGWRTAWLVLAAIGIGLQSLLMWSAYRDCSFGVGCNPHHGNARPLQLLAGFAIAGAAMVVVLVLAAMRLARERRAR